MTIGRIFKLCSVCKLHIPLCTTCEEPFKDKEIVYCGDLGHLCGDCYKVDMEEDRANDYDCEEL